MRTTLRATKKMLISIQVILAVAANVACDVGTTCPGLTHILSCYFILKQLGFKKRKSTGFVDIEKVYTSGRYFIGPDFTFKVFQAHAHFVELDKISVWTGDKVEIKISCNFQYFLRKDFLPDLHEAYNVDYKPIVKGTAIDAIKGRAAVLPIEKYIRFVLGCD